MPKCPICLAAYLALWTGLGLSLAAATYLRWVLLLSSTALLLYVALRRKTAVLDRAVKVRTQRAAELKSTRRRRGSADHGMLIGLRLAIDRKLLNSMIEGVHDIQRTVAIDRQPVRSRELAWVASLFAKAGQIFSGRGKLLNPPPDRVDPKSALGVEAHAGGPAHVLLLECREVAAETTGRYLSASPSGQMFSGSIEFLHSTQRHSVV